MNTNTQNTNTKEKDMNTKIFINHTASGFTLSEVLPEGNDLSSPAGLLHFLECVIDGDTDVSLLLRSEYERDMCASFLQSDDCPRELDAAAGPLFTLLEGPVFQAGPVQIFFELHRRLDPVLCPDEAEGGPLFREGWKVSAEEKGVFLTWQGELPEGDYEPSGWRYLTECLPMRDPELSGVDDEGRQWAQWKV
jgi:hypothetical protein